MNHDDWFTLEELAGRLGSLVWVEQQLGQLLTAWSALDIEAKAAVLFATAGRHHQWHAQIVGDVLPTSPQLLVGGIVVAPTPGWQQAMATLADLTDPEATMARLGALVRVINPWLERETTTLLELARPISDAAMSRWLRFTLIDHDDDGKAAVELHAALSSKSVRLGDHVIVNSLDLS